MTFATKAFAATILSVPLALLAATEAGVTPYSGAVAQAKLDEFCSTDSMKSRNGQAKCLQETAGQSLTYATTFHAALFKKVNVPADAYRTTEMVDAINKIVTDDQDRIAIQYYGKNCTQLQDAIMAPDMLLDFGYTTAYNLPKSCVETGQRLSRKYKIDIDLKEGDRLSAQIARVYKYYAANPKVPSRDAFEPKQVLLHGCTRDNHGINYNVSISAKGEPDRVKKFDFDMFKEALNTTFQEASRQSTAAELKAGGKASYNIHTALKSYNDKVSKNLGLDIRYKGLQEGSEVTDDPIDNCLKNTI